MDMSTSSVPWLDQPVMLHSSRADSCTLTPAQCAYRRGHWRYWYQADHVYGLETIYFMCATIGIFVVAHLFSTYAPRRLSRNKISNNIRAVLRYLSYRGLSWSPGIGVSLLILAGTVFFFAMTLGPKPYYWPNTKTVNFGSSPPIATRSGWMALGLLPFVLALSTKANLISAVTGISYEKLQIFHHWTSYAMFVLALVHTFPFIVYHISKGDMVTQWQTQVTYWTGVVTIISQAYLTFMSLPCIRNRYYEFFKATHILAAIVFVVFFFLHCDFRLSSWDYFIATGTIYFFCLLYSLIRTYLFHGLHTATLTLLPCGLLEIRIPTVISWTPGQHVFIRFLTLGIHSLTAHPFTIASAAQETEKCGHPSEMTFHVKPQGGLTARLAKLAENHPNVRVRVLLDGPYGGVNTDMLARLDTLLVIAGGSGAGFSLGVVEDSLRRYYQKENTRSHRQRIQIVYATRQQAVAECAVAGAGNDAEKNITTTKPASTTENRTTIHIHKAEGRPDLKAIISSSSSSSTANTNDDDIRRGSRSIGIVVCGPTSMIQDVRNAVAKEQLRVLREKNQEMEVYLHAEHFS
ncbi:hypothetical protein VTN77DRAFT_665 [Rasamsonia byssochlamydoides]|uniref:uncharacterized protein n=1 Tax=Rasamsonia byssochlamydoides TaxID=89139 RepID=UPI003743F274